MRRRSTSGTPSNQPPLFNDPDVYRKTAPCVYRLREAVEVWRQEGYPGVTKTTRRLLQWWFYTSHSLPNGQVFHYYRAQQEAIETLIYAYEVAQVRTRQDLLRRFAPLSMESVPMEYDHFPCYCVKMATGSGKTKVMALAVVWHYCNALLEQQSNDYARSFLILAPNIIVLERLQSDFIGGRIFQTDPMMPEEIRSEVWDLQCIMRGEPTSRHPGGVLFLTNVQQLYQPGKVQHEELPEPLAALLKGETSKLSGSRQIIDYLRQRRDRVLIMNDEAHHAYHGEGKGWQKVISDVASVTPLVGQLDFSATPREKKGDLFSWIISDYPLRQAIADRVVKRPYRGIADFKEDMTSPYASQRYKGFLVAAIERWREYRSLLSKAGKRPLLFIMLGTTAEADEVGHYLKATYPEEFGGDKTLVIHTGDNGEIKEKDLEKTRKMAREVDDPQSQVNVLVSVLMLREGWDVQNVTVVVGLRPFTSKTEILPEQAVGRGMRLMFQGQQNEYIERVDITGNAKFLEFLDQLEQYEQVSIDTFDINKEPLGSHTIEPDHEKRAYDIVIPRMGAFLQRKQSMTKAIETFDLYTAPFAPLPKKENQQTAQHIRYDLLDFVTDEKTEERDFLLYDWKSANEAIGNYARLIAKELHFTAQFAHLVPKIREFLRMRAFGELVDLHDPLVLQTLGRKYAIERVKQYFIEALGRLLIEEVEPRLSIEPLRLSTLPRVLSSKKHVFPPKKCILTYAPCSNIFEQDFAQMLDQDDDILAWCKLDERFGFTIEYLDKNYNLHLYHPDFVAKSSDNTYWVIETKGREDENVKRKDEAAKRWCQHATHLTDETWRYMKVPYDIFKRSRPDFYDLRVLYQDDTF